MNRVTVMGSVNMDMTIYVDRIPARGETVLGNDFLLSPGGKGGNQAVAASRLGADVRMFGVVGEDVFGESLIRTLNEAKVNTDAFIKQADVSTGVASITVCQGDNQIALFGGANQRLTRERMGAVKRMIEESDILLLQLEVPLDSVLYAIDIANACGTRVFLNPAPAQALPAEVYKKVDYLLPNESEAGLLLNRSVKTDDEVLSALTEFSSMGVKHPVITLGSRGVACILEGVPTIIDGYRVKAVDTTAAGDTFIGALSAHLGRKETFAQTIDIAQRAAAICVTRQGAQKTIPTLAEVEDWDRFIQTQS